MHVTFIFFFLLLFSFEIMQINGISNTVQSNDPTSLVSQKMTPTRYFFTIMSTEDKAYQNNGYCVGKTAQEV